MDTPNAFVDHTAKPTPEEIAAALGPSSAVRNKLVGSLADGYGVTVQEWKSSSPKHGWSLRLKLKKRTILYSSPCHGCFRVSFALGDRAVEPLAKASFPGPWLKPLKTRRATLKELE
jgi:hypothetical protein